MGHHGIAWAGVFGQRESPVYWPAGRVKCAVGQTLTEERRIHAKAIPVQVNIRVSFLWTTLWSSSGSSAMNR
jgi:hypothetical protein